MPRHLKTDLRHLNQLAFRRRSHRGPLFEKFHVLAPKISALLSCAVLMDDGTVLQSDRIPVGTPEDSLLWSDDPRIWKPVFP